MDVTRRKKTLCSSKNIAKGAPLFKAGLIITLYLSLLFLQNWFVYDKIPTNLAGEKHLIVFENNFLPLAENYNAYCQVDISRVFNYT